MAEQVIGGYPPEDLVQWRGFVAAVDGARRFARETAATRVRFGSRPRRRAWAHLYNVAALVHAGAFGGSSPRRSCRSTTSSTRRARFRAASRAHDVLDGVPFGDLDLRARLRHVALEVCEDGWSPDGPMRRRCFAGAELVVNVSASPFRVGIARRGAR
jgi:NAD+ synthase (glutamine-hydrolysing)